MQYFIRILTTIIFFILSASGFCADFTTAPLEKLNAVKSVWQGGDKYDFKYAGRSALIVVPPNPRSDNAWVMRPAFFGAFPNADIELLKRRFFLAYYDLTHCYATPEAVKLADDFFKFATIELKLKNKVVVEGLSRGGACSLNWANSDPSKFACIYVDAPVCDFRIWPAQKELRLLPQLFKEWKISSFENFKGNPIDNFENLARSGVPVLMVAGDSDKTVPYSSNGEIYTKRFFDGGGNIRTIIKKGCDHHPHGLTDPSPIIEFIENNSARSDTEKSSSDAACRKINFRSKMSNSAYKFGVEKSAIVAFVGGSITEMNGWRNMVQDELKRRFPQTKFRFIDAGISSLGTTPHSFRLDSDVPNLAEVDMMFIEGAVNDDTNGFTAKASVRGMEGVVRRALLENPAIDIIMLQFIYDGFLQNAKKNEIPNIIAEHEKVAGHYNINSLDLYSEVAQRMRANEFDWKKFGGTHPAPFGHRIYARSIAALFDKALISDGNPRAHNIPAPLDEFSYFGATFYAPDKAKILSGWTFEKNWRAKTKTNVRSRFKNIDVLETRQAGAEIEFNFKGTAIGIYCLTGDEAGILEYSIDGGEFKRKDTFTQWSKELYLPWVIMFVDELADKPHTLKVRMAADKNPSSNGTAAQIIKFCVNSSSGSTARVLCVQ